MKDAFDILFICEYYRVDDSMIYRWCNMDYTRFYESPLGRMVLAGDGESLTGLWFAGQKYFPDGMNSESGKDIPEVFRQTEKWLDIYFRGEEPDFMPRIFLQGTDFQKEIWDILRSIPYGKTMTYGEIGNLYAKRHGMPRMSAQAVGQAVGHNPVAILIPCHRVLGSKGKLTGYAGGINKKTALLRLERVTGYEASECGSAER